MDIDDVKDNLWLFLLCVAVTVGGIIVAPFYIVYLIGKGFCYFLPSNIRKRKVEAREKRDKEEKEKLQDTEIEELEKRMGISSDNKFRIFYDKYYYKNPESRSRDEYLEDLKKKVAVNYASPNIIVAVERYNPEYYESLYKAEEPSGFEDGWILCASDSLSTIPHHAHKKGQIGSGRGKVKVNVPVHKDCYVVLLIHKDYYHVPEDALIRHKETIDGKYIGTFSFNNSASVYFGYFSGYMNHFAFHPSQMTEPVRSYFRCLYTLMECGNYDNYFIVQVPDEFQFSEVEAGTDERLNEFIADFKRKYKKDEER